MAVITAGTTGATWGLTAETGVIAQALGFKVNRELKEEKNPQGDACLLAWSNAKAKYNGSGVLTSTLGSGGSGWAAAAPGAALVIANDPIASGTSYGITGTNGIYVDDIDAPRANTEFVKFSFNATKYAIIA